jgi:ABC-2 type transport system ATP-binding protein
MWLERFSLIDQGNRKIEELSKGNQQKIQFILALLHDPGLLILDEPFTGLDPLNQLLLKEIIQEKREEGKTIVFSTHQMEQVERLCTNICLINKGKIIVEGVLDDIRKAHTSDAVEVRYSGTLDNDKARSFFTEVEIKETTLSGILRQKPDGFLSWVNGQVTVESFQVKVPNLEQIFIEEVKKTS